jgi:hypothetical protein
LPGDAGFGKRLLPMAERLAQTTVIEKEEVSRFSKALLLGKPATVWNKTDSGSTAESGSRSRTRSDSPIDAGAELKSHSAKEL